MKPKPVIDVNSRNVEGIVIPTDKRPKLLKELRRVL